MAACSTTFPKNSVSLACAERKEVHYFSIFSSFSFPFFALSQVPKAAAKRRKEKEASLSRSRRLHVC